MPKEIERKFLLNDFPREAYASTPHLITQGYISIDPEIRIRSIDNQRYCMTIKTNTDDPMVRHEKEIEITAKQFEELRKEIVGRMIQKVRYNAVLCSPFINVELDQYTNELYGIKVAEIEFECEEDATNFKPPIWFGKEVTNDSRYRNVNIAKKEFHR